MSDAEETLVVRRAAADEVERVAELLNEASASDIRHRLREQLTARPDGLTRVVLVAVSGDEIVGAAKLTEEPSFAGTASAMIVVDRRFRGRGIGTRLWNALSAAAVDHAPLLWTATLREGAENGLRFAERLGFSIVRTSIGWSIELADREQVFARELDALSDRIGVTVRRADFETEPDVMVDVFNRSVSGLPGSPTQSVGRREVRAYFDPATVFLLAELDGRAIGLGALHPIDPTGGWYTDFTGVDPSFRRRGVARLLKLAELRAAAAAGGRVMSTHTDERNEGIVKVNAGVGMHRTEGYWSLAAKRPATQDSGG